MGRPQDGSTALRLATRARSGAGWLRAAYIGAQGVGVLAVALLARDAGRVVSLVVATIGALTLTACIIRSRPDRRPGWWLVAAGALVLIAAIAVGRFEPAPADATVTVRVMVLAALTLIGTGVAALGWRRHGRTGGADLLDAAMTVGGGVLLAWVVVGNPFATTRTVDSVAIILTAVFAFGAAARLILIGGLQVPALALLISAVAACLGALTDAILPAAELAELTSERVVRTLLAAHGWLLGAAAVHPSFATATRNLAWSGSDLNQSRIVMFIVIAIVVPAAVVTGVVERPSGYDRSVPGVVVPAGAAAVVLLCLVGRLVLIAHVSQRRAREIARQSAELRAAAAKQAQLREQMAYRAMHDPLTGLSNRVVLAERLEWALQRADTAGLALLLIDLDGFKDVNDRYGHPVGDEMLTTVARRLRPAVPDGAVVARLGGDEFAILLESASPEEAMRRAEDLLSAVQQPLVVDHQSLYVSASIGLLAIDTSRPTTVADVLRDADLALYAAKKAGRSQVVEFDPQLRRDRLERVRITTGLQRALARGELTLAYQPIVALETGRIYAVEALVRWQPPDGPAIPPALFIPIAEATGLIDAIGARVLRQACLDSNRWYHEHGTAISVNVSGRQLADPGYADAVLAMLLDTGLPAAALILELTEQTMVATAPDRPEVSQLWYLRNEGVRIAIDDFGTGYSSLASVSRLPVDIVKLDATFAEGIMDPAIASPKNAFLTAILNAVASIGLETIVEGVETPAQASTLRTLNCRYAQGFHFHKPMSAEAVSELLSR